MGIIENMFCDMEEGRGSLWGTGHHWRNAFAAWWKEGEKKCQNCDIPLRISVKYEPITQTIDFWGGNFFELMDVHYVKIII